MSNADKPSGGGDVPWEDSSPVAQHEAFPLDPTADKTVAEVFGEIVWLMTQDPNCQELKIRDLERLVMPAILLKQFHITYAPVPAGHTVKGDVVHTAEATPGQTGKAMTALQPLQAELYALVSEDVAARLDDLAGGLVMSLPDWRSGTLRKTILTASLPMVR